jgi:uncharacterized protein YfaS (alpha-2-macroglobulin family)
LPSQPLAHKVEVFREYLDREGKPLTAVQLGDEIQVHLRLRALGAAVDQIAVVDLLPGGFEPVVQARPKPAEEAQGGEAEGQGEGEGEARPDQEQASFALPIALPGSTFEPSYGDIREDRVVLYGAALPEVRELVYALRATNTGTFTVPPVLADALYDRSVVARGVAGKITVNPR